MVKKTFSRYDETYLENVTSKTYLGKTYDETIFNQIKKDSGFKREQKSETEHKLYIRTM